MFSSVLFFSLVVGISLFCVKSGHADDVLTVGSNNRVPEGMNVELKWWNYDDEALKSMAGKPYRRKKEQ